MGTVESMFENDGPHKTERLVKQKIMDPPEPNSVKNDQTMDELPKFEEKTPSPELSENQKQDDQTHLEHIFKEVEHKVIPLVKKELKRFRKALDLESSTCSDGELTDDEDCSNAREGALKITVHILRNMNQTSLANVLQTSSVEVLPICLPKHKSKLMKKFQTINEGISENGKSTFLNEVYTELDIAEGTSGEASNEHEVRQIEMASMRPGTQGTPIKYNDIFNPLPGRDKVRTVLTKGVAGIGKTVCVQKFILDWAEGKANQDVYVVFPLSFRELNLLKVKRLSLMDLLQQFFTETKDLRLDNHDYKAVFILDGLDECRLPLDFHNSKTLSGVKEAASIGVLLTNLIKGTLLPSALVWITSRPAAASQIPAECVDQVIEVRGFGDPQKEEYFRKRIRDQNLANKVINHIKSSRSLYTMCHVPAFCWISATVLERMLIEAESDKVPKTLTQMAIHFLIFQIKHGNKNHGTHEVNPHHIQKSILTLGKLAFQQLEKGNMIFSEEDLRECGIDAREASMYSGVYAQIFRQEFVPHLGTVYSFVHLSIQEFLAALFVFLSFILDNKNVLEPQSNGFLNFSFKSTMTDILKKAVDKASMSANGHLDLFLRFLLGLSLESNQSLLEGLLTPRRNNAESKRKTIMYIQRKIRENPSTDKSFNLFYCLNELQDHSLVKEVRKYLANKDEGSLTGLNLSPAQWSALVFVLLNSEEKLDEFNLLKYDKSEECFIKLLQVVKVFRKAILSGCNLTKISCEALASALSSNSCSLRDIDLGSNCLLDSGVKLLSAGLKSSHCKLDILRLYDCGITEEGCADLVSALRSNPSHLKELDLGRNPLKDSGVKLLATLLEDPNCKLEKVKLFGCGITEEGCAALAEALKSNPLHLRELNLGMNKLGDSASEMLSALLEDPHYRLEKLHTVSYGNGQTWKLAETKF